MSERRGPTEKQKLWLQRHSNAMLNKIQRQPVEDQFEYLFAGCEDCVKEDCDAILQRYHEGPLTEGGPSKEDLALPCVYWTSCISTNRKTGVKYAMVEHCVYLNRFLWQLVNKDPPQGYIENACGHFNCVNPFHLVQITDPGYKFKKRRDTKHVQMQNLKDVLEEAKATIPSIVARQRGRVTRRPEEEDEEDVEFKEEETAAAVGSTPETLRSISSPKRPASTSPPRHSGAVKKARTSVTKRFTFPKAH